ncbi:MAG: hypothetical protein WB812_03725 [Woeseiaceae bacterium]
MRLLLMIAALALAACGPSTSGETAHSDAAAKTADAAKAEAASKPADDSLYESVRKPLDKAEGVEDTLQQAAKQADDAIEKDSGD